jgi:hypothetical protein
VARAPSDPRRYVKAIAQSGLTIYDPIPIGDPALWIPAPELQELLDAGLRGISVAGLKPRTRSKIVKENVCRVLGYPVPTSFRKTKPRFPGQFFDTYSQKSNNLQVWNDQLGSTRRYVIVRISEGDVITRVKVVTGDALAPLDTKGTLTQKYQARCIPGTKAAELVSPRDTNLLRSFLSQSNLDLGNAATPISHPAAAELLPIAILFERLKSLVGRTFTDSGHGQERKRGAILHDLCCRALGYKGYEDDGQFPDIRHQLLELKLQTSPTIDLGLVCPNSEEALDVPQIRDKQIRHCDTRYAVFYARIDQGRVTLTHLLLTTGEDFFNRFPQFQGKVLNKKLQIPLPADFFDR